MQWLADAWTNLESKHYGAPVARLQGKGDRASDLLGLIKAGRNEAGVPEPVDDEDLCAVQRLVVLDRSADFTSEP